MVEALRAAARRAAGRPLPAPGSRRRRRPRAARPAPSPRTSRSGGGRAAAGSTRPRRRRTSRGRASSRSSWKPGSLFGIAPMSPPPWTLFWPRSGCRPEPHFPTLPVSSARLISAKTLSTALWCSVIPSVQQSCAFCALAVRVRELADRVGRDAGHALRLLERPRLDRLAVRVEAGRRALDELQVGETGRDDLARDGVRERDVGADVEPEPEIGPLRRRRAPRVDDDQLRAVVHGLEHVVEEDRVRLARVRAPEHDQVRGASLLVGARPAARTEHRRQTDDAGRVSGSVAAVDVVRAEDDAGELLRGEVQLVRRLGAAEDAGQRAFVERPAEAGRGAVERLVPARRRAALRPLARAASSAFRTSSPCVGI